MANFEDAYKAYTEGGRGKAVAGVYDAQTQAELGGLKAAYDTNLANQQAAREKIGATYQQAGNTMQAQYERNRRNLNQQAAANGINTGAGSQQQLALQNTWNRDYGALQGQQAQAYADADREIANLQVTYQNAIQQAQAQGDYRKMAALLDDYNQQYNQRMNEAKLLAAYGDFSGYNGLYSDQQIANMRSSWIAQNPLLAYNTGAISAADYQRMTGQYALGYAPAATYSSGGRRGGGGGSVDQFPEKGDKDKDKNKTASSYTGNRDSSAYWSAAYDREQAATRKKTDDEKFNDDAKAYLDYLEANGYSKGSQLYQTVARSMK